MKTVRLVTAVALTMTGVVVGAGGPSAEAAANCTIEQLTTTTGGSNVHNSVTMNDAGTVLAFHSDRSYSGQNADNNVEIFRMDVATHTVTAVTNTTGGTNANLDPAMNADGTRIAFSSNRNIGATNADLNREIYQWVDGVVDVINPITVTTTGNSTTPVSDDAGTSLAFSSTSNLDAQNADGSSEIFLRRTTTNTTTQLTASPTGTVNEHPDISANGSRVAFESDHDHTGNNADGNTEVFLRDLTTGRTLQQTRTNAGFNMAPQLTADGRRIAFSSSASMGGQNPGNVAQAFFRDTVAGTTRKLTYAAGGGFFQPQPTTNGPGTRFAFVSSEDLTGTNSDDIANVFVRDVGGTTRLVEIGDGPNTDNGAIDTAINRSGTRIVFSSFDNPTGGNADLNKELFLATCSAPPPAPRCDGQYVSVDRTQNEVPTNLNDVILGKTTQDTVNARGGRDRFCGRGGEDIFNGGVGNDRAFGDAGNDRLQGGPGNDVLIAGPGDDRLNGGTGPDTCSGGPGTDSASACSTTNGIP